MRSKLRIEESEFYLVVVADEDCSPFVLLLVFAFFLITEAVLVLGVVVVIVFLGSLYFFDFQILSQWDCTLQK